MIDITVSECSKGMYLFCFLYYMVITFCYRKRYNTLTYTANMNINAGFFFMVLIYLLLSFRNGDYWHYREFVVNFDEFWMPSEPLYDSLATFVGRNYLLFRLVVWGAALCLYLKIVKRFKLNRNTTLYFLFTVYILFFEYARASLAMAVFFLGLSYVLKPSSNAFFSTVFGIAIMVSSYFFHHSMLVLIILSLVCLFPVNKHIYIVAFICLPLLAYFVKYVLESFLGIGLNSMEVIYNKMEGYSEYEATELSILETIRSVWKYSLFYIPLAISSVVVFAKKNQGSLPSFIKRLYSITYAIILFATCFLFMGFDNNIMYYRFLYMSMIPLSILMSYFRGKELIPIRIYKYFILWAIMYVLLSDIKKLLRFSPIK